MRRLTVVAAVVVVAMCSIGAARGAGSGPPIEFTVSMRDPGQGGFAPDCLFFSGDGTMLVAGGPGYIRGWDVATQKVKFDIRGERGSPRKLAGYARGGGAFITQRGERGYRLHDGATGAERGPCGVQLDLAAWADLAPDASRAARVENPTGQFSLDPTGRRRGRPADIVEVINLRTGAIEHRLTVRAVDDGSGSEGASGGRLRCLAFTPDSKRIGAVAQDGTITVWDAASGREVAVIHGAPPAAVDDPRRLMTWLADGNTLIVNTGGDTPGGGGWQRCDVAARSLSRVMWQSDPEPQAAPPRPSGRPGNRLPTPDEMEGRAPAAGFTTDAAFAPDGKRAVTIGTRSFGGGGAEEVVGVVDLEAERVLGWVRLGGSGRSKGIAISPDSRMVAVSDADGNIRVWELAALEARAAGNERLAPAGDGLVDSPLFASWAGCGTGSYVEFHRTYRSYNEVWRSHERTTVIDRIDDGAVLRLKQSAEFLDERGNPNGQKRADHGFDEVPSRLPPAVAAQMPVLVRERPGMVARKTGRERVKVGDRVYECDVYAAEERSPERKGEKPVITKSRFWVSPEVPGLIVKMTRSVSNGGAKPHVTIEEKLIAVHRQ